MVVYFFLPVSFDLIAKMSGKGQKEVLILVRRREAESKKARELAEATERLVREYNQEIYSHEMKLRQKTEKNREKRKKKKENKTLGVKAAQKGNNSSHAPPALAPTSSTLVEALPPSLPPDISKHIKQDQIKLPSTQVQPDLKKEKPNSDKSLTSSSIPRADAPKAEIKEKEKRPSKAQSSKSNASTSMFLSKNGSLKDIEEQEKDEFLKSLASSDASLSDEEDSSSQPRKSATAVQKSRRGAEEGKSRQDSGPNGVMERKADEKTVSEPSSSNQKRPPGNGYYGNKKKK